MQDLPLDVQLAGDINAAISEDNEVLVVISQRLRHSIVAESFCNSLLPYTT